MSFRTISGYLFIWFTILVSLVLSLLKLPIMLDNFIPSYVSIVIIAWAIIDNSRVNVLSAWVTGLLLDILLGCNLGIHAASMAFMVWIVLSQFDNIKYYSLLQKSIVASTVNFVGQFILFWIEHIFGGITVDFNLFWSCLSTLFAWPVIYVILYGIYSIIEPVKLNKDYA